jgi:alkanesulfonate monooxygenase SsuD/methylene tetrahydromethanopterin reductase-like flavin-dependent oxidoreductase (luciferase family)
MRFSVHLPLIGFEGDKSEFSLAKLQAIARTSRRLGFQALTANDHLVFGRPWLDGPTALAAVASESEPLRLMTTVAVPAIRHPLALAKTLSALDILSDGRVTACLGPGSSARDYAAVGLDFEERWPRLDECVKAIRAYFSPDGPPFSGRFYSTEGVGIAPLPVQQGGIPIWIGSWGSDAGLRRVARLADGWLASAYNTTPEIFADAKSKLDAELTRRQRDPATFPNALATTFMYLTDNPTAATQVLTEVVAPAVNRKPEEIGGRILVCSPAEAVDRLSRYAEAGLREVCLWPALDEEAQLERFVAEVAPGVP